MILRVAGWPRYFTPGSDGCPPVEGGRGDGIVSALGGFRGRTVHRRSAGDQRRPLAPGSSLSRATAGCRSTRPVVWHSHSGSWEGDCHRLPPVPKKATRIFVTLSTFAEYDQQPLDMLRRERLPFICIAPASASLPPSSSATAAGRHGLVAGVEPSGPATRLPGFRTRHQPVRRRGVDALDLQAARERGVAVVNTPERAANERRPNWRSPWMLALSRNLPRQAIAARAGQWSGSKRTAWRPARRHRWARPPYGRRVATLVRAFGTRCGRPTRSRRAWCAAHSVRAGAARGTARRLRHRVHSCRPVDRGTAHARRGGCTTCAPAPS